MFTWTVAGRDLEALLTEQGWCGKSEDAGATLSVEPAIEAWKCAGEADHRAAAYAVFLILMLSLCDTNPLAHPIIARRSVFAIGAVWFLYGLGYNMSIGVWVGLIDWMGVDAETAYSCCLSLIFLTTKAVREGAMKSLAICRKRFHHGPWNASVKVYDSRVYVLGWSRSCVQGLGRRVKPWRRL